MPFQMKRVHCCSTIKKKVNELIFIYAYNYSRNNDNYDELEL